MSNVLEWFLKLNTSALESASKKAEGSLHHLGEHAHEQFSQLAEPILAVVASVGSVAAAMEGVHKTLELGSTLQNLANETGIASGSIYDLRNSFSDAGVDAEKLGNSVAQMKKHVAESVTGGGDSSLLHAMGLDARTLASEDPAEAFEQIGHAIHGLKNPTEQGAAAMALFGKQGDELLKLFNSPEFDKGNEKLSATGELLSANSGAFKILNDAVEHVGRHLQEFFVGFSSTALPSWVKEIEHLDKIDLSHIGVQLGNVLGNFHTDSQAEFKAMGDDLSQIIGASLSGDSLTYFGLELIIQASKFGDALLNAFKEPLNYMAARAEATTNMVLNAFHSPSKEDNDKNARIASQIDVQKGKIAADREMLGDSSYATLFNNEDKARARKDLASRTKLIRDLQSSRSDTQLETDPSKIAEANKASGIDYIGDMTSDHEKDRANIEAMAAEAQGKAAARFKAIHLSSFTPTAATIKANADGRADGNKQPSPSSPFIGLTSHSHIIASSLARIGGGGNARVIGGTDPMLKEMQRHTAEAAKHTEIAKQMLSQLVKLGPLKTATAN